MFDNSINIQGHRRKTVAVNTAIMLEPGVYDVWAENEVTIAVDQNKTKAEAVTAAQGYLIRENNTVPVHITTMSYFVGQGTGDIYIHRVS